MALILSRNSTGSSVEAAAERVAGQRLAISCLEEAEPNLVVDSLFDRPIRTSFRSSIDQSKSLNP